MDMEQLIQEFRNRGFDWTPRHHGDNMGIQVSLNRDLTRLEVDMILEAIEAPSYYQTYQVVEGPKMEVLIIERLD